MIARRTGATLTLTLIALIAAPSTASAHVALLFSSPSPDSVAVTAPTSLTLVFGEDITIGPDAVTATGTNAAPVNLGSPTVSDSARVITVAVNGSLAPGIYVVHWIVTSGDGDLVDGTFRFGIGDTTVLAASPTSSNLMWGSALPTALLRWLLFTGLALALGGLAGERITTRRIGQANRARVVPGCLLISSAAAVLAVMLAAAGGLATLTGTAGVLLGVLVVAGLTGAALAMTRLRPWAVLLLAVVIAAEAVRAHPGEAIGVPGSVLTALHLTAAALWVGALIHVLRVGWPLRKDPSVLVRLFTGYATMALAAFVIVVVTGTLAALALITLPELISTAYGRVLLIKLGLVAIVAALAFTAQRLLKRRQGGRATHQARAEAATLLTVLAVTGLLVSLPVPALGDPVLPFAPAPIGVVVPVGTRAGQIGVAASASSGQLIVQLSAPGQADQVPGTAADATTYGLTGGLSVNAANTAPLTFRGCGFGCFVAAANWQPGVWVLTLDVAATGWTGGTAGLLIPWPGRPDPAALVRTLKVMSAIPALTVFEDITSDTTTAVPAPVPVAGRRLSGKQFIASEPYSGGAPITTAVGDTTTRLLLGFPADNYTVDLSIDRTGRIQRETLISGKHLINRTFAYP